MPGHAAVVPAPFANYTALMTAASTLPRYYTFCWRQWRHGEHSESWVALTCGICKHSLWQWLLLSVSYKLCNWKQCVDSCETDGYSSSCLTCAHKAAQAKSKDTVQG